MVARRVESGTWVVAHPRVYRLAGVPETWHQRVLAACLACGGVASHRSAARLWKLDLPSSDRIEVTTAGGSRKLAHVRLHHATELPRTTRDDVPVTSIVRTLLDLAGVLDELDLEACLHSALRDGHTSLAHLQARLATRGRPGGAMLRELVAAAGGGRPFDSRPEIKVSRMLVAAGLPRPVRQHVLNDEQGRFVARFDLAWPEWRLGVEFQSWKHHHGRRAWRRDQARANRAVAQGWRVLAATEDDVGDDCRTLARDISCAAA